MIIQYQYNDEDKTFEVDLPEVLYLRHNILTKETLAAALNMEEYAEDPSDMYEYSEVDTTEHPLASFWLCKKQHILDDEDFVDEYEEIIAEQWFEILLDEDGQHVVNIIDVIPPVPPETSEPLV